MNLGRENETMEFKESTAEFDRACKAIVGMLIDTPLAFELIPVKKTYIV